MSGELNEIVTVGAVEITAKTVKDITDKNDIYDEIDKFMRRVIYTAGCAKTKALFYHIGYIGIAAFVIFAGLIISIISLFNQSRYIAAILGFSIAAAKVTLSVFRLEKRAYSLTNMSHKMLQISRNLRRLKASSLTPDQIEERLESFYDEVNAMELELLNISVIDDTAK
jgi:hypothetical protein